MNKAGGLFKTGLIMVSCHVVNECNRWVAGVDQKKMEAAATKKVNQLVDALNKAKRVSEEWLMTGRKVDANGCPDLDRPLSYAMVKFPLPKIDIMGELRLKDFGTMKKCNKWCGGIGRGMTWDERTEAAMTESRTKLGAPLFAMGGLMGFLVNEAFPHHLYNVIK